MNLKDYKFVITAGCSYDRFKLGLVKNYNGHIVRVSTYQQLEPIVKKYPGILDSYNTVDDKVICVHLGEAGYGNQWISESTIYFIEQLFKFNVDPANIYVLASFSNFARYSYENYTAGFDFEFSNYHIKKVKVTPLNRNVYSLPDNYGEYYKACEFIEKIQVGSTLEYSGLGVIGLKQIIYPKVIEQEYQNQVCSGDEDPEYLNYIKEKYIALYDIPDTFLLDTSLNCISNLGTFLTENKVDYDFTSMHSIFTCPSDNSSFAFEATHVPAIYEEKNNKFYKIENDHSKVKTNGILLSERFPQFKEKINDIIKNFNWTFYETDDILFGGIDEWTIHQYGEKGYGEGSRIELRKCIPFPMNHPHFLLYPVIFNFFAKHCKLLNTPADYITDVNRYITDCYEVDKPLNPLPPMVVPKFDFKNKFTLEDTVTFTLYHPHYGPNKLY